MAISGNRITAFWRQLPKAFSSRGYFQQIRSCTHISQILNKDKLFEESVDQATMTQTRLEEIDKNEFRMGIQIQAYNQYGFRLNNNVSILGPIALFPKTVFSWNIGGIEEISPESLCLFTLVNPKIETLYLGIGDQKITPEIGKTILQMSKQFKLNVEVLSTEHACTTFNFLNQHGRMIAAALIPPRHIDFSNDDIVATYVQDSTLFTMKKMHLTSI